MAPHVPESISGNELWHRYSHKVVDRLEPCLHDAARFAVYEWREAMTGVSSIYLFLLYFDMLGGHRYLFHPFCKKGLRNEILGQLTDLSRQFPKEFVELSHRLFDRMLEEKYSPNLDLLRASDDPIYILRYFRRKLKTNPEKGLKSRIKK